MRTSRGKSGGLQGGDRLGLAEVGSAAHGVEARACHEEKPGTDPHFPMRSKGAMLQRVNANRGRAASGT